MVRVNLSGIFALGQHVVPGASDAADLVRTFYRVPNYLELRRPRDYARSVLSSDSDLHPDRAGQHALGLELLPDAQAAAIRGGLPAFFRDFSLGRFSYDVSVVP